MKCITQLNFNLSLRYFSVSILILMALYEGTSIGEKIDVHKNKDEKLQVNKYYLFLGYNKRSYYGYIPHLSRNTIVYASVEHKPYKFCHRHKYFCQ